MADLPFRNVPVAPNTNRANSSGMVPGSAVNRTSTIVNDVIKAGQTKPYPVQGTQFYFLYTTAGLLVRPKTGTFNRYQIGQGLNLQEINAFPNLEIKNDTANDVVFSLFVGFDGFIDNTLILNQVTNPNVGFPTYPTANAATSVAINDLSGTQFTDINGKKWFAINRVAIVVSNVDSGVTLLLQKAGANTASGPAVCAIFPLTSIRLDLSGNYALSVGGGNINAIVSEIYQALPAT